MYMSLIALLGPIFLLLSGCGSAAASSVATESFPETSCDSEDACAAVKDPPQPETGATFYQFKQHIDSNAMVGQHSAAYVDCQCRPCGWTTHYYTSGECGPASTTCSAAAKGPGCYTEIGVAGQNCRCAKGHGQILVPDPTPAPTSPTHEACTCIPCGYTAPRAYNSGTCAPVSHSCGADSRQNDGCYTNTPGACDCANLKALIVPTPQPTSPPPPCDCIPCGSSADSTGIDTGYCNPSNPQVCGPQNGNATSGCFTTSTSSCECATRVADACSCIPCGASALWGMKHYGAGICGPASDTCGDGVGTVEDGCYTESAVDCDCSGGHTKLRDTPFLMTHDAATGYVGLNDARRKSVQTQTISLVDQLSCGARAMDIRLVVQEDNWDDIRYHHTSATFMGAPRAGWNSGPENNVNATFPTLVSWAQAHPHDLVILSLSQCFQHGKYDQWDQIDCFGGRLVQVYESFGMVVPGRACGGTSPCSLVNNWNLQEAKNSALMKSGGRILVIPGQHSATDGFVGCVDENYDKSVDTKGKVMHHMDQVLAKSAARQGAAQRLFQLQSFVQQGPTSGNGGLFVPLEEVPDLNVEIFRRLESGGLKGVNFLEINLICAHGIAIARKLGTTVNGADQTQCKAACQPFCTTYVNTVHDWCKDVD